MATKGSMRQGAAELNKYSYCQLLSGNPVTFYSVPSCIGEIQTRDPEPSGSFRPGIFRVNPVVIRRTQGICSPASCYGYVPDPSYQPCGNSHHAYLTGEAATLGFSSPSIASAVWDDSLSNWALQEALGDLMKARVGISLILGELGETLRLMRNPLQSLGKLLNDLRWKRGIINPKVALADCLAGSWLTAIYGMIPLMQDIQDIMETAEAGLDRDINALIRSRGGTSKNTASTTVAATDTVAGPFRWRRQVSDDVVTKATCVVYARWKLDASGLRSADWGFDPRQFPSVAWELLPLSFVVDWVLNVGSWLQAIMPTPEFAILGNCVSQKTTIKRTTKGVSVRYYQTTGSITRDTEIGNHSYTVENLERRVNQPMSALPASNLDVSSLTHVISSLALIWSNIPQKWKRRL